MPIEINLREELRAVLREELPSITAALIAAVRTTAGDRLLGVVEAAQVLGCSPAALRKKIERGAIPAVRHGRSIKLRMSDLLGLRGDE